MIFLLFLCLIGLSIGQVPQPCISPSQWEARIYSNNQQQKLTVGGTLSYDSTFHRSRFVQEVKLDQEETAYDIISLFEMKTEFLFNLRTKNCTRRPINQPWRDFGIQPDAKFVSEAYIGSSAIAGAGLLVTIWSGNHPRPENKTASYIGTWTYQGCLPVSDSTKESDGSLSYTSFYDVVAGVSDPNVFIPSQECLTDQEYAMRYTLFGTSVEKK